jgi:hypothetical protein
MPVNLTLNGVAFANPATPGYFAGLRVVVEVSITVSDPTIALIDAQQGGEYTANITPTLVRYRSASTGAVLGTGALVSTSVKFHSLQRSYPTIGRLVSLSQGGTFYTGTALCTTFAVVGASTVADSAPGAPGSPDVGGLYGRYYNNLDMVGLPVWEGKEVPLIFLPAEGLPGWAPAKPGLGADFSARWTGFVRVPTTGKWRFQVPSDDGSRFFFQGVIAWDAWGANPGFRSTGWLDLTAGVDYAIWLEYLNVTADAAVRLDYQTQAPDGSPLASVPIPGSQLYASLPVAPTKAITVDTRHSAKTVNRY